MKMPASGGAGEQKEKKKKRERNKHCITANVTFASKSFSLCWARFKGFKGKRGGFGNPYLLNQPSASPIPSLETWTLEKNDIYLFIYIFFHSPLLTNIWRALHLFSTGKLDNSVKFARMKKGGTGRGGGVARVQNTICIQREKKKKKKKLGEKRGREKF